MSFIKYLREQEDAAVEQEMDEKKAKIIALFTTGEPVTDEMIVTLGDELEMDAEEVKAEVYTILSDLLMAQAEEGGEVDGEAEEAEEEEMEESSCSKEKVEEESEEAEEDDTVEKEDEM